LPVRVPHAPFSDRFSRRRAWPPEVACEQDVEPGHGRCTLPRMAELHVVLVAPEIHWNTGNAGRTCLAAGAQLHLVEPLGFSLDDAQVRRAGLDYWPRVRPRVWPSWEAFERELPALGAPFFYTSSGARAFQDVRYPRPCALV